MSFELARRQFLYQSLTGVGAIALRAAETKPHHEAKAKACIFLTMLGGVSQMDTFDPKPALEKFDNTVMDWSKEKLTDQVGLFVKPRLILKSPWKFSKHGKCGQDVSELLPHLATCVDDLAFVKSVVTENGNHPAATFLMNTGFVLPGRPSVGAWTTYGLGSSNKNLPGFVVLPDFRALPFSGTQQWGPGFLPASYQGTMMQWKGSPIADLKPAAELTERDQTQQLDMLRALNTSYLDGNFTNPELQGRIDAYELAYRMQTEVPGVLNIDGESEETKKMYGLDDEVTKSFGTRCLMARQMVEKGVRFVQLYTPSQSWDSQTTLTPSLRWAPLRGRTAGSRRRGRPRPPRRGRRCRPACARGRTPPRGRPGARRRRGGASRSRRGRPGCGGPAGPPAAGAASRRRRRRS